MATIGPNDLKSIALPAGIDQTVLRNFQLRSGQTYEAVVRDLDAMLQLARDSVMGGPLFDMVYMSDRRDIEYRIGTNKMFERHTEYAQPDSQLADTTGHMLPLVKDDHKLGWTDDFLEEARQTRIDADIAASIQAYRDRLEQAVLTRLFKATADSGKANGLGSSGISVPLADAGTADATYVPMQRPDRAGAFSASHTHFLRLNGITQANLETAVDHLWEHGHDAPYDLLASAADLAAWQNVTNVTGFVPRNYGLVQFGSNTALAQGLDDKYQGVITTKRGPVRLWTNARIPTTYWSVYKSYGRNDVRNPIWMYTDPMWGTAPKLVVTNVSRYPLTGAIVQIKYGIGIGEDRVSAVAVLNAASGSYASPTIS
jgi:hypothetical protein